MIVQPLILPLLIAITQSFTGREALKMPLRPVPDLSGKFHRAYDADAGVLLLELDRSPVNAFHEV